MDAIETKDLVKKYGEFIALNSISFNVKQGERFGLLGPNGAGKTTTIKILTGLVPPTSGTAIVAGYDVVKETKKVKERIGWVASEVILDDDLNAWENLEIQAKLQGVSDWEKRAKDLLDYFGLSQFIKRQVGKYSTGMRKKLEIASALLNSPEIIFMDEPTIGLDVNTRSLLWNTIRGVNKEFGVSVLLTTHYMEEADSLCDRIAIINQGKIAAIGTPDELKSKVGGEIVEIEVTNPIDTGGIRSMENVIDVSQNQNIVRIKAKKVERLLAELPRVIDFNNVKSLRVEKPSLDTVFLELTGRKIQEEETDFRKFYMTIRRARQ